MNSKTELYAKFPSRIPDREYLESMSSNELLETALSIPPVQSYLEAAGTRLNILEWGDRDKPGLLFIHGGAAHAGWWRFIAPYFLPRYHCIAVDVSGHGDSARREHYAPGLWAEEVLAVAANRELFPQTPVVVSHSMGGLIGIRLAAVLAEDLPGLVIIDTSVRPQQANHSSDGSDSKKKRRPNILAQKRLYESRQLALKRFRLIPPQPCKNKILVDFIAAESIRKSDSGWTWKFDPAAFRDLPAISLFDQLKNIACPTAIIFGEYSKILSKDTAEVMKNEIRYAIDIIEIKDSNHHVLIDQPAALISEIIKTLRLWEY